VHLDSCEEAFDQPLMYEAGWGKKLDFTFAVSSFGIVDVTPRYTRNFDEVSSRRNVNEEVLAKVRPYRDIIMVSGTDVSL
jgi:peptide-N4-(N-acetyl-beta-glucosaminyl)asparagine amidase